jgi:hypothetical protein
MLMFMAAQSGDLELARLLIESKADINYSEDRDQVQRSRIHHTPIPWR